VQRAMRQQQYNAYVIDEVVPFIVGQTSPETMIIAAGVSFGAFLAANAFFHRPDLFGGMIAMSGMYDIKLYADGYYDGNCYFNNPVDYLPNLNDPATLDQLRSRKHIYLLSGKGDEETPEHSIQLAEILGAKGIPCHLDLWGEDIRHDWPTWRAMLPHVLSTRL
jgi:esterase/lipase superfamily enzyme